ncbi:cobalt ECF transporter T component CbiQ [Kibdelosporangium phytohabitans]|uniref:Cobalt ABC transporter permease n=1 Tax=Kibdelosporangium phytohabitans TaxID=860235 RepID=A0A0N9HYD3_9PSEU|nr:cobalt ECF transporter T component CbiQ [Kibdelosporangium phytohabitans]ALG07113.1 cobalt ABC transporter permease [Kibdelosporangium phytohabitans]MBE1468432.1 cobalt/nickel transport system permease protein [Kibdelosporangium phytohabitans]
MGAGHSHLLYRAGDSAVHRVAPQIKIVAALAMVLCVVATPRSEFGAFAAYLVVLVAIWSVARVPVRWFAARAVIEVPFVVLAVLLPFVGGGPRTDFLGLPVSVEGSLAGWNILVKGTLGVLVSLTMAATTSQRDLIAGLQRLRVPSLFVTIATLMVRYVEVIVEEARRMRIARISRGHDPRFLWQLGATARGIGTLFIRSYERGERVHIAMVSRGWSGVLPDANQERPAIGVWVAGLVPAAIFAVTLTVSLWT